MKIKFITLNIWDGGRLLDSIISFIKKENPDVVALQEVYDGKNPNLEKRFRTTEILQKELDFPYFVFSPAFTDAKFSEKVEQGNAILSRFPILDNNVIFFVPYGKFELETKSKDYRHMPSILQSADVGLENNVKLSVCNIHGIWDFDGEDNDRRLKMSRIIVDQIKNKKNIILAGDFNIKPNTKTIGNIESHLKNVFKNELSGTFNMKHKKGDGYQTSAVDMVFVGKHLKVLEHYCPNIDVSDHLPLVCVLEL